MRTKDKFFVIWILVLTLGFWSALPMAGVLPIKSAGAAGQAAGNEPSIRVGLATGQSKVSVSAPVDYAAFDGVTGQRLGQKKANTPLVIMRQGHQLMVDGKLVAAKEVLIKAEKAVKEKFLSYDGKAYRGDFRLLLKNDGITVINEVKLDDYVSGVIGREMGADWPTAALQAQAVAARTFALYSIDRHAEDSFDVCSDTHCQVYGGVAAEDPPFLRAVAATRGEVMLYGGEPIYAAFHASSGGWTAGSEEAGGVALPYLKPVRDEATHTTRYQWEVIASIADVSAKLRESGFNIGALKAMELSPLAEGENKAADRYLSGRVRHVRFIGSSGAVEVPGHKLRWIFGLPSTRFEILGRSVKAAKHKGRLDIEANGVKEIVFSGWGRGHGIGMSQWGAYAMAAKADYRTILRHYYTDIEIRKLY